jgi:hypothetical protein
MNNAHWLQHYHVAIVPERAAHFAGTAQGLAKHMHDTVQLARRRRWRGLRPYCVDQLFAVQAMASRA